MMLSTCSIAFQSLLHLGAGPAFPLFFASFGYKLPPFRSSSLRSRGGVMATCSPGPSLCTLLLKKSSPGLCAVLLLQACSVLSCSNRNGVTGRTGDPTAAGTQSETSATTT